MHTTKYKSLIPLFILCILSCLVLALVTHTVCKRIGYAHGLSNQEGSFVEQSLMLANDRPIYAEPSSEFIASIYTPISHFFGSWLIRAGLGGFLALRLVSIVSLVGACIVGMWLCYRFCCNRIIALLVPVLIAANYFNVDCYYDHARPDNLMTLFLIICVAATTANNARIAIGLAVCSSIAAVYTKQSCVVFLFVYFLLLFFSRPKVAILSSIISVIFGLLIYFIANSSNDGWFHFYIVELPSYHGVTHTGAINAVTKTLLTTFWAPTVCTMIAILMLFRSHESEQKNAKEVESCHMPVITTAMVAALISTIVSNWNLGAQKNNFIFYAALAATYIPMFVDWTITQISQESKSYFLWQVAFLALSVQIASGIQSPRPYVPTNTQAESWNHLTSIAKEYGPLSKAWFPSFGAAFGDHLSAPIRPSRTAILEYTGGIFGRQTGHGLPTAVASMISHRELTVIFTIKGRRIVEQLISDYYIIDDSQEKIKLYNYAGFSPGFVVTWIPKTSGPSH